MGFFKRIGDIFRSNVNDALDKAENPEKMIKLMVVDMKESINQSTAALAKAMAHTKQMEKKMQFHKAQSDAWQQKAMAALQAGNEELAKKALAKKNVEDTNYENYKGMYEQADATTTKLKGQLEKLKAKYDEAKAKESMLIARSKNAEAQSDIAKNIGGFNENAFANFDKFEEKILEKEAEAEAYTDMSGAEIALEDEFAAIETDTAVDAELAKLKEMMNK
ncbi:MAG: PspA/IM30 family protein [Flavobacteriales bacterium]|nr:PspA/IM30 family protein [Flavobacteriales bacterium]